MLRETSSAAIEKALQGVALRQQAIADNLANAETPGHRPRRVQFEEALRSALQREQSAQAAGEPEAAIEQVTPAARRQPIVGSQPVTVQMETEMTNLAETSLQYEALTRTLTKQFRMIRSAITGGAQQ